MASITISEERKDFLWEAGKILSRNVVVKPRAQKKKIYHDCFIGSEAVSALVKLSVAPVRADAIELGNEMMQFDLFRRMDQDGKFEDSPKAFYRFQVEFEESEEEEEDQRVRLRLKNMEIIDRYISSTDATGVLKNAVSKLFSLQELPYNPFSLLVDEVRPHVHRFSLWQDSDEKIKKNTINDIAIVDPETHVTHVHGNSFVWGIGPTLKIVDVRMLRQMKHALKNVMESRIYEENNLHVTQICALVGGHVFSDTFLPHPPSALTVRSEFFSEGGSVEQAVGLLAKHMVNEIRELAQSDAMSEKGIFLGVSVPAHVRGIDVRKTWTQEEVLGQEKVFVTEVMTAVVSGHMVYFDMVFAFDKDSFTNSTAVNFHIGRKEFAFHFRSDKSDPWHHYNTKPFQTLYEGVFFDKTSADVYSSACRSSINIKLMEERKHKKEESEVQFDVMAKTLTAGFRENVLKRVKVAHKEGNKYVVYSEFLLLSLLEDRQDLLPSLYRMFHSMASKLEGLQHLNRLLYHAIQLRSSLRLHESSVEIYTNYKTAFTHRVAGKTSFEFIVLRARVEHLLKSMADNTGALQFTQKTLGALDLLYDLTKVMMISIAFDVAASCADVTEALANKGVIDKEVPPDRPPEDSLLYSLMFEWDAARKIHDRDKVILVAAEQERNILKRKTPVVVVWEGVLLQYSVDTGLDEALRNIWNHLLNEGVLSPNPFPVIVHMLNEAKLKFPTMQVTDSALLDETLAQINLVDAKSFVYSLETRALFGTFSSVALVDSAAFSSLLEEIPDAANNQLVWKIGSHKLSITTGVAGDLLLSKVIPTELLNELYVVEDYIIDGPEYNIAVELYMRNVYNYILYIFDGTPHLVEGVYLDTRKWLVPEAKSQRKEFLMEMSNCVQNHHPVKMKMYMRMRRKYMLLTKEFRFHHSKPSSAKTTTYHMASPVQKYFTAYLSQDRAATAHMLAGFQNDPREKAALKPCLKALKKSIRAAVDADDLLTAFHDLLLKCLCEYEHSLVPSLVRVLQGPVAVVENLRRTTLLLIEIFESFVNYEGKIQPDMIRVMILTLRNGVRTYVEGPDSMAFSGCKKYIYDCLNAMLTREYSPILDSGKVLGYFKELAVVLQCHVSATMKIALAIFPDIGRAFEKIYPLDERNY